MARVQLLHRLQRRPRLARQFGEHLREVIFEIGWDTIDYRVVGRIAAGGLVGGIVERDLDDHRITVAVVLAGCRAVRPGPGEWHAHGRRPR
ncbi:MAG: hypothetical protein WCE30_10130, partial [Mycobacterium sp.]